MKQQSWLEFTTGGGKGAPGKKKRKRKKGLGGEIGANTIFRTEDGIGAKVGVISGTMSVKGVAEGWEVWECGVGWWYEAIEAYVLISLDIGNLEYCV